MSQSGFDTSPNWLAAAFALCLALLSLQPITSGAQQAVAQPQKAPAQPAQDSPQAEAKKAEAKKAEALKQAEAKQTEVLKKFSKHIDQLKAQVDEWGTVSVAPIIFANPDNQDHPFALKELNTNTFSLDSLYSDYNAAQGRSLFGQRTQTRTAIAAAMNSDALLKQTQDVQMNLFQQNAQRSAAAAQANSQLAQSQLTDAQSQAAAAKIADQTATDNLNAALTQQSNAIIEKDAADKEKQLAGTDPVAQNKAALAEIEADKNKAIADNAVAAAQAQKTRADSNLASANGALTAAQSSYTTTANAQLASPQSPYTNSLSDPLASISSNIQSLNTGTNLAGLGNGILPTDFGSNETFSFSPFARINSAASALTVKNILTFLGNPQAALTFQDKRILFGVTSVSVNPGWRTKRNFKATIAARVQCNLVPAHKETIREILRDSQYPVGFRKRIANANPSAQTPEQRRFFANVPAMDDCDVGAYIKSHNSTNSPSIIVYAISPMVDSQNLDLASSIARQDEIALYLAASLTQAGAKYAGSFFNSWARLRRKDVSTRSTIAVANSSTMGGGHFSFELGTRLRGLDDDEAKGNKAAQVLDRQTFPVLLLFGMTADDARPQFELTQEGIKVSEPELQTTYSTSWSRVSHGFWSFLKPERSPSKDYATVLDLGTSRALLRAEIKAAGDVEPDRKDAVSMAIGATKTNMENDYNVYIIGLFGAHFELQLPAKWMLNSGSSDTTLNNPDGKTDTSKLKFEPSKITFENTNAQFVILKECDLGGVDVTNILPTSSNIQRTTRPPFRVANDQLAIEIYAAAKMSGTTRFLLPSRAGGLTALTPELPYGVNSTTAISVKPWGSDFVIVGKDTAGKWTGKTTIVLKGDGFDRLNNVVAVKPSGAATLIPSDSQTATIEVSFTDAPASGQAYLQFSDKQSAATIFSEPFKYQFVKAP